MSYDENLKFWRESAFTIIYSSSVIVISIIITGILSRCFSLGQMEDYLFIRRFTATFFPLATLGVGTGLTWALAKNLAKKAEIRLLSQGTLFILLIFNLLLILSIFLPEPFLKSNIFPLQSEVGKLWFASIIWLTGYTFYVFLYSYQRGLLKIDLSNKINLIFNGISPLLIICVLFILHSLSVYHFILIWGLAYFLSLPVYFVINGIAFSDISGSFKLASQGVMPYSLARIPAGFLLAFPAYVIPFFMIKIANNSVYFLSAFLVLQTFNYLTDPLGQVFLPHSANWFEENAKDKISKVVSAYYSLCFDMGIFLVFLVIALAGPITYLWFGAGYGESATALRVLSVSIVPTLIFNPARNILDGIERKPLITHYLSASSLMALGLCYILFYTGRLDSCSASAIIVFCNYLVVALITIAIAKKVHIKIKFTNMAEVSILGLISCLFAHSLCKFGISSSFFKSAMVMIISCIFASVLFFSWANSRKPEWWLIIKNLIASQIGDLTRK